MAARALMAPFRFNNWTIFTGTGNYTIVNEAFLEIKKAVGAATTVTLPVLPSLSDISLVFVKDGKGDAATNNITVQVAGGGTIDGAAAHVINTNYGCAIYRWNGVEWGLVVVMAADTGDDLTVAGVLKQSATNGITAFATGGQTGAAPLTTNLNRITVCATAGDSVKLPTSAAGLAVVVTNVGAADADVFPATGDAINNLAANLQIRLPTGMTATFVCDVAGTWSLTIPQRAAKYTKNTTSGATTAAAGDLTGAAYVQAEYSAVGAANLQVRTAAQMIADGFLQVGDSYVLEITNSSGGTTTLTTATGVTLTGTMTMATNTTRRFNVKVTGAAALTIQSTGVGTIS